MPPPSRDATLAVDLSPNALLAVSGDDAAAFLHGQFTNDVEALDGRSAQWNSWLTAKGRILATFLLVHRADHFLLLLPREIAAPVAKRLGMFVLRSKVKIEDASDRLSRLGLFGPNAAALVANAWGSAPAPMRSIERDGALAIGLEADRFLIVASADHASAVREKLASTESAGYEAWEAAAIRAGVPTVVAATQEAFIPQMLNFELLGGVSFKKGCYPGQEIVARAHYRGGVKRRMARAHANVTEAPKPGDPLFSPSFGDQAAGEVVNVAPSPDGGFDLLVVAQLDSLRERAVHLSSTTGPALELLELPYTVPLES